LPSIETCPRCKRSVPPGAKFCQGCGTTLTAGSSRSSAKAFLIGALAIVLLVGAIGAGIVLTRKPDTTVLPAGNQIRGAGVMPDWLQRADPNIIADYAWAAEHYQELRWIPCYCGCSTVGHTSNATCYYRYDKDGKILGYDAHAMT